MLPGFSYVTVLGSGGFADVFLYEQDMPRRQVAVKVMLAEIATDRLRAMFRAEADLMAQLSAHPSVLTVHQASVAADGRPYLVMELCSSSLSDRYRREPLGVAEVLRVGIRIASAVETAHRAGVLHRDIKPANILTTAFGHPVLSDFGIASTLEDAAATDAVGLSIPWSAPEVLADESPGTVRSEVWSLAATVYSLLAGRSPFEVPGGQNAPADLVARIQRARPLPTGRADVPERLELVLRRSMSRQPEARPGSALAFVRELQAVEAELQLAQTPLEVASEEWASAVAAGVEEDDDPTRVRGIVQVDPGAAGAARPSAGCGGRRRRRAASRGGARERRPGRRRRRRGQPVARRHVPRPRDRRPRDAHRRAARVPPSRRSRCARDPRPRPSAAPGPGPSAPPAPAARPRRGRGRSSPGTASRSSRRRPARSSRARWSACSSADPAAARARATSRSSAPSRPPRRPTACSSPGTTQASARTTRTRWCATAACRARSATRPSASRRGPAAPRAPPARATAPASP
ncbi:serine/threonine-protein kinase [Clavibacter tessellarius]|uniref:serine/threonine-protein kinase n=1 Tax=Clavibacter tessellarius TaxID=31965 RepID=UPI003248FE6C